MSGMANTGDDHFRPKSIISKTTDIHLVSLLDLSGLAVSIKHFNLIFLVRKK
jgi:hypothetical protein